jgi:hypothetical protein
MESSTNSERSARFTCGIEDGEKLTLSEALDMIDGYDKTPGAETCLASTATADDRAISPYRDMDLLYDDEEMELWGEDSDTDYMETVAYDIEAVNNCGEYYVDTLNNTTDQFTQLVTNALRTKPTRRLLVQYANTLVLDAILYVSNTDFSVRGAANVPKACEFAFANVHRRLAEAHIELYTYVSICTTTGPIICAVAICEKSLNARVCDKPCASLAELDTLYCCDVNASLLEDPPDK